MCTALLKVARDDAPIAQKQDQAALKKEHAEKHRKEELLYEYGVNKASDAFIDALYYYEMYCSLACWKTVTMVDCELKKLKSKSAKLNALKENIRMCVLGLEWKDLSIPWSKQGKILTVNQLTTHLKSIILQQKKGKIPNGPPVKIPQRKSLPSLSVPVKKLIEIDKVSEKENAKFEQNARNLRNTCEEEGIGDRYAEMQPSSMPKIDKYLIGKRLDICESYDLEEGGSELRWNQGKVVLVSNGANIVKIGSITACYKSGEAVMICWDSNNDRNEPTSTSPQRLLPSKWNPKIHSNGA